MYLKLLLGIFLILTLLGLIPSQTLPFWRGGQFSDVLITHWPNAQFTHFSLNEWGQVPLWNPTILSGMPFIADPLSGLWYPPNWLAVLHPSALAFNALFLVHLLLAFIGMWKLTRNLGVGKAGTVFAAMAFVISPKLLGHIGLGHLSWVMASAWVPWVFLGFRLAARRQSLRSYALAGSGLGLVFLIDPRWVIPLGLMTMAFALREIAHSHNAKLPAIKGMLTSGAFGIGLAAVGMLPLLELVRLTTRASLTLAERSAISISFKSLIGLVVPELGGWPETQAYVGLWILIMVIVASMAKTPRKYFWLGAIALGWLAAMGELTPLFGLYGSLIPGASFARVPARFLSVISVPIAVLAGHGFESALNREIGGRALRVIRLTLIGIVLVAISTFLAGRFEAILSIIWAVFAALLFFTFRKPRLAANSVAILAIAFATFDVIAVSISTLELRPVPSQEIPSALIRPAGQERILSPSYSLPALTAVSNGLQLADGVNPLQLRSYWDFMSQAMGFEGEQYSVTLPPYPAGDPSRPLDLSLRLDKLKLLAVDTVISSYTLDLSGYQLTDQSDRRFIYSYPENLPRVWVESPKGIQTEALIKRWSPNQIDISANGPGRLVLSEVSYPGWRVSIDGEIQDLQTAHGLLRTVQLEDGIHDVTFRFVPKLFLLGLFISTGTLLGLGVLWRRP